MTRRYNDPMLQLKTRPNHALYLRTLRRMGPEVRLRKAFELSAFARALFRTGLERRFPGLDVDALRQLERRWFERRQVRLTQERLDVWAKKMSANQSPAEPREET